MLNVAIIHESESWKSNQSKKFVKKKKDKKVIVRKKVDLKSSKHYQAPWEKIERGEKNGRQKKANSKHDYKFDCNVKSVT